MTVTRTKSLARRILLTLGIAGLLAVANSAPAAVWTGAISNDVNTNENWDSGIVPAIVPAFFSKSAFGNDSPNLSADWNPQYIEVDSTITSADFPAGYTLSGPGVTLTIGASNGTGSLDSAAANAPVIVSVDNIAINGGSGGAYLSAGHTDLTINSSSLKVGTGTQTTGSFFLYADSSGAGDVGNLFVTPTLDFSSNTVNRTLNLSAAAGRSINLNGGITGRSSAAKTSVVSTAANKSGITIIGGTSININATNVSVGTIQIDGNYSGTTATVSGSGTMTVNGNYAGGNTTVSGGTLQVNGTYAISGAGTTSLAFTGAGAKTVNGSGKITIGADNDALKWINMGSSSSAVSIDTANIEFYRGNSGLVSSSNPDGSITVNSTSMKMGLGGASSSKNFIETGGNGGGNIVINPSVNFSEISTDQPLSLTAFSGTAINLNGGIVGHSSLFTNVNVNNDIGNDDANQTGRVTIAGTSTFNGTTTVGNGAFIVNGDYNGNNPVTVNPGATIGGTGTIGSAVTIAGNIAPGDSAVGTLTIGGSLDLSAAGNMTWKLGALSTTGPGTNFDTLAVGGELFLGGAATLTLDFNALGGDAPGGGNAFWNSPHTWKIVETSASTNGSNFGVILNGNFASGNFTTTVGTGTEAGDILLNYATATPGDFNGDGNVNGVDFSIWQNSFPTSVGGTLSSGDADGDGDVDGADFIIWQTHYPTGSQSVAVPEPAGCALILLAAIGPMLAYRTKQTK